MGSAMSLENKKIAIVVSEFNSLVTENLLKAAKRHLISAGVKKENLKELWVPGAFELPLASLKLIKEWGAEGVCALGCVVRGGTPHFDYVCSATAKGIMDVNTKTGVPVSFGVLTTDTEEQALSRAGGKSGNKGIEAASALVSMLKLDISNES